MDEVGKVDEKRKEGPAHSHLDAAARLYQTEVKVLKEAAEWVPFCFDSEGRQALIRDVGCRNWQVGLLLKARAIDKQAVVELRAWS